MRNWVRCFSTRGGTGAIEQPYRPVSDRYMLATPYPREVMVQPQQRFHLHTLGCPKNQVDSDKIAGTLIDDGLVPTEDVSSANLVVVNTCAFIEEAREESINAVLQLEQERMPGSRIVITGCLAAVSYTHLTLPTSDLV